MVKDDTDEQRAKEEHTLPDTKYAWVIAVAAFCNLTMVMGILNAYGVYQEYYLNNLYANESAVAVAWVATLISCCMFFGGIFTGKLTDWIGYRTTCCCGAIICGGSLILASFTNNIWQLILTQGVVLGFGASLIFSPSMAIVAQWHVKHRVLATGIAVSGGGVGGMVFSVTTKAMLDHIGYRWSLRTLGAIIAVGCCGISLLYRQRIPPRRGSNIKLLFALCKDTRFVCIAMAVLFINMGYFEPLLYVPTAASQKKGSTEKTGANIVLVFNAGTTVGRILSGPISGAIGPVNANLASAILSFTFVCIFLVGVNTVDGYYVFSALFGTTSTMYLAINAHILAQEFGTDAVATSIGLTMACCGMGVLIGNPVQGALYEIYDRPHNTFVAVSAWAAGCFGVAMALYAVVRFIH